MTVTTLPVPVRTSVTPRVEARARHLHATARPSGRPLTLHDPERAVTRRAVEDERPVGAPAQQTPLPDPTALCCAVVRAALETLRAERPVAQLTRWVAPEIYDALSRRARLTQAAPSRKPATLPVQIRRARVVRIGETAAEATVVVEDDDRVRAAAVRLEARRGTWRVVALEIG
ncbi:Rv3235 family protein [Oerskovia flava]|uniref:Rv3235 family protein n=1 Tax=Oerskovia flava TaxID=2986422 RepID=UPI00223F2118|nr:Rv3235 family protein [Oerskovia sp. JB1-3-2]